MKINLFFTFLENLNLTKDKNFEQIYVSEKNDILVLGWSSFCIIHTTWQGGDQPVLLLIFIIGSNASHILPKNTSEGYGVLQVRPVPWPVENSDTMFIKGDIIGTFGRVSRFHVLLR